VRLIANKHIKRIWLCCNKTIEELIRFEPVTSPEIRGWLYEAISSTREDCEKERKIEAHTQVSMNAYDKGFENGQKAERERILEMIDRMIRVSKDELIVLKKEEADLIEIVPHMDYISCLEELKKEVLKE